MNWAPGIWKGNLGLCFENKIEAKLPEPYLKARARRTQLSLDGDSHSFRGQSSNHSPKARIDPHFQGLKLDPHMSQIWAQDEYRG